MAQHDYDIQNDTGANVRQDINNVLDAIATNNNGNSAPSTTFAHQFFANNTDSIMQIRDAGNSNFINLFTLAGGPAFPIDGTINSVNIGKGANSIAGNTVLGELALDASVSGGNNTAIGKKALTALTSGANNTAIGVETLQTISTASSNTAIGSGALKLNDSGAANTSIGAFALDANDTGSFNTAIGTATLGANTSGSNNVAIGRQALAANTTADDNVAIGVGALGVNETGTANVAIGKNALDANTTADNNTAVGHNALTTNSTGVNNVAVGSNCLDACSTGFSNVAIGQSCLGGVVDGDNNSGIGNEAGLNVTTGNNNLFLGHDAGTASSPSGSITTESNRICIGDNSITNAHIKVAFTVTSDARDKIEDGIVSHGLDFVNKLQPKSFWFKKNRDSNEKTGDKRYGFYAQDILALEGANPVVIDNKDLENLKYKGEQLIPILVNAIKELSAKVTALEAG